jgi:hypothetical protein
MKSDGCPDALSETAMNNIRFLIVLTAILGVVNPAAPEEEVSEGDALQDEGQTWRYVSIVRLIANPDEFDGELVWFVGVMDEIRGTPAVYLNLESYELQILANAILIMSIDEEVPVTGRFDGQYVTACGRFHTNAFPSEPSGWVTEFRQIDQEDVVSDLQYGSDCSQVAVSDYFGR